MTTSRVLYVSGSIGLGHVTRDIAIARALREAVPGIALDWLAGDAARGVLAEAGEPLLPEAARFTTGIAAVEIASRGFALNLADPRYALRSLAALRQLVAFRRDMATNLRLVVAVTRGGAYDLVVGDETFELAFAFARNPRLKAAPFALITDFIGVEAMTGGWLERLVVRVANRGWTALLDPARSPADRLLFVGERDDVPEAPLTPGQAGRRELATGTVEFLGYILPFDPAKLADRGSLRARLGYGSEPLVVCAIGGTTVGAPLLQLCADAAPRVRRRVPGVRFVLVCGPRLSPSAVRVNEAVEVRGFVPRLHEHLAACDLAVVQAGGTTTLELTALRRPFLYFPLEGHFEQQVHVAERLRRHGAGVRLRYSETTAPLLADAICAHIGAAVTYPPIAVDGATRAATVLAGMLEGRAPARRPGVRSA
jgi:UDP:flavonoid glycosyltransferase YjiC (YdhE family)